MNILHITPDFNFAMNFVKPVCLEQVKLNNNVTVISTQAFYSMGDEQNHLLAFEEGNPNLHLELLNLRLRKFETSLLKSYWRYIKILLNGNHNVIVFHTTIDTLFPLILALFFSNAKRIYFNHGVPSLGYKGITRFILNHIEKLNTSIANRVFTIGPSMSAALKNISRNSNPIYIAPGSACGIQLISNVYQEITEKRNEAREKLNISIDKKVVIFVGRPVKRKGIFEVIEAWKTLAASNESFLLLLAGPEVGELKEIAYSSNIMPLGYISDMNDYYLSADVLCVPSYHEGLGYTYLEAASAGCVPISCEIPGPTDFVINNLTGLTVRPGNVEDIHRALKELLENDEKRLYLSENAFNASLSFNQEIIAPAIAKSLIG